MPRSRRTGSTPCCARKSLCSEGQTPRPSSSEAMAAKDQIDQDALAAEWGVALDAEQQAVVETAPAAEPPEGDAETMAAHWATMVDDGQFIQAAKGGAERILTQEEIDSLLGFSLADVNLNDNSGIRAIIDSAMVSYERLPMLEIVFDRLV